MVTIIVTSFIISIIALGVALMPFLQMLWGKPNLKTKLTFRPVGDGLILDCLLTNRPVTNQLLKWLGVYRRTIDDLTVVFDVENTKHKIMASDICANISAARNIEGLQVPLPSSIFPATFMVLHMDKKGRGEIIGKSLYRKKKRILEPGAYILILRLYYGDMKRTLRSAFILDKNWQMLQNKDEN